MVLEKPPMPPAAVPSQFRASHPDFWLEQVMAQGPRGHPHLRALGPLTLRKGQQVELKSLSSGLEEQAGERRPNSHSPRGQGAPSPSPHVQVGRPVLASDPEEPLRPHRPLSAATPSPASSGHRAEGAPAAPGCPCPVPSRRLHTGLHPDTEPGQEMGGSAVSAGGLPSWARGTLTVLPAPPPAASGIGTRWEQPCVRSGLI